MSESQGERGRRFERRGSLHLAGGAVIGLGIGLFVGIVIGIIAFTGRTGAIFAAGTGGAIFGAGVGMLVGGYSSLESPDPGREPSDTERPVADRPELAREEAGPGGDGQG